MVSMRWRVTGVRVRWRETKLLRGQTTLPGDRIHSAANSHGFWYVEANFTRPDGQAERHHTNLTCLDRILPRAHTTISLGYDQKVGESRGMATDDKLY